MMTLDINLGFALTVIIQNIADCQNFVLIKICCLPPKKKNYNDLVMISKKLYVHKICMAVHKKKLVI